MTSGRAALVCLAVLAGGCRHRRARVVRCPQVDAAVVSVADASEPATPRPTRVPEIVPQSLRVYSVSHPAEASTPEETPSRLPTSRPPSPRCPTGSNVTAWLSHDPHVPLARVTARGIASAGQECCEPFAVRGSRWREIDRWGQVVGEATMTDGAYYDVTRCLELGLSSEHAESSGLFASASGPWHPSPSLRHDPDLAQWTAAVELDNRLRALHPETLGVIAPRELPGRSLFFRWQAVPYDSSGAEPSDWLVLGRLELVIARWDADYSNWRVVEMHLHHGGITVTPIGVFDLDGDGVPEVIVQEHEPASWRSVIYQLSPDDEWRKVATSIWGSTA